MRPSSILTALVAMIVTCMAHTADAQTQPGRVVRAAAPVTRVAAPAAPPVEKCFRALNGACMKPAVVEAARLRAIIIPSVRVSYLGTPAGTIGGKYIPFERLFKDNTPLFGLPTSMQNIGCCIFRSK